MAQLTGLGGAYEAGNSEDRTTTAKAQLGALAYDKLGNEYRYVKAGAAIAAGDAVRFQGSALGFDDVRPTSATLQTVVGVALTAFASGEFGFVLRRGIGSVKTTGSVAANIGLASSGTAGTLATTAATDTADLAATVLVSAASPQVCYIQGI